MQHETYKEVFVKELTRLNGMDETSTKALTVIMQELRRAANHPYLIDGIEPTPSDTIDGTL